MIYLGLAVEETTTTKNKCSIDKKNYVNRLLKYKIFFISEEAMNANKYMTRNATLFYLAFK